MIRAILGGTGSGKSVTATKFIKDSGQTVFGNYRLFGCKDYHRLKYSDIIKKEPDDENPKKIKYSVNWDFWKNQVKLKKGFHIVLDEVHNLMHSRRAMSRNNILISQWVSQIRKITGDNENFDLVCISQELQRIDVSIRDLLHEIIFCKKKTLHGAEYSTTIRNASGRLIKKKVPVVWVIMYYFQGIGCARRFEQFRDMGVKSWNYRTNFVANPYFKYYNSYDFIELGEEGYL